LADRTIKRNDLTPELVIVARDAVGPADLEGATALFRMVNVLNGATKVNAAASVAANINFTASGATLTANGHGLNDGESVTLKTTGTLPAGLSASTEYFVVNATTNTLQLSLTQGGSAITTTSAGSGTHSLISGRVSYDWQGTDTDTAGTFFGEVQTTLNGETLTYPNTRQLLIEVVSDLV
jgi:hypothetical protein